MITCGDKNTDAYNRLITYGGINAYTDDEIFPPEPNLDEYVEADSVAKYLAECRYRIHKEKENRKNSRKNKRD